MRSYELIFIVRPEIEGDDLTAVVEAVKSLIERGEGEITKVEPWGLRRLAYPIQDQSEGQYVLMQFNVEPQFISELEHDLGLNEQIMRHLIVRME